jgi:hypothetical protein
MPRVERLYGNADPRKRDLEQLEQISSAYSSRQAFLSELTLDPPQATGDFAGPPSKDGRFPTQDHSLSPRHGNPEIDPRDLGCSANQIRQA